MSLLYDRDRNISGVSTLTGLTISPEYGSTASFENKNAFLPLYDKYSNIAPQGLNSLVGTFNWNFSLRKADAQSLVNFYESQSGTGIFPVVDHSNIYRTLSGTITSLSELNTQNNQKYSTQLEFAVERNSPHLNWSGQSFVNHSFVKWQEGLTFGEDDVVWFENDLEEPTNNWFYSISGHTSSIANHPLSTGNLWTKNLFQNPNGDFSFSQQPTVKKNEFRGSFAQRIKEQKNIHSIDDLTVSYKNLTDKKTKAILHFLESKIGYKKFEYQVPEIYNRPKLFFCPSWNHQWNAKDSNNLTLRLIEDPLGLKGSGNAAITLVQASGNSSLRFSATGDGYCFYDTGDGKTLVTGTHLLSWQNTGINHSIKFYGRVAGLTGSGQSLVSARFDAAKQLKSLNLSGNQISNINLYYSPILENVIVPNNRIGGFDLAGKTGLKYFDANNNSGVYLNIGECYSLTGLKVKDNDISGTYIDSALSGLYSFGNFSGLADFSGNSAISESSSPYVTGLTGRGWDIRYDAFAATTTTTTTTTTPPAFTIFYPTYASNGYSLADSSVFNFSGESIVENGPSLFFLSDGDSYYQYSKICCSIASFVGTSGECSLVTSTTTTEGPTTTTTTTTEEPSTTTTSSTDPPGYRGCTDPAAINYDPMAVEDNNSCIYP